MRKINKTVNLATKYKKWQDTLVREKKRHPKYTSSTGFYYDIVANLLWVQKGLCAYSERRLQSSASFAPKNWKNGRFKKFQFAGQLDHYNNTLKISYGWLWDNFFLIDSDINVKLKRSHKPSGILKPDLKDYDPIKYLEYDFTNHFFIPHRKLDFKLQDCVRKDISYLGLNFQPIIDIRREYLAPVMEEVKYGKISYEDALSTKLNQFYTAFQLSKGYMTETN